MVSFAGLKTPYAIFIIVIMVLGIVAGAFFFYNAASQYPCGNPGPAKFSALPDLTLNVNGQPKTYKAIAANFTGTQQPDSFSGVTFTTTAFDDPTIAHVINGSCGTDTSTPASITLRVAFYNTGQSVVVPDQGSFSFKGPYQNFGPAFTPDFRAGIYWDLSVSSSLVLLVAA